VNLFSIYFSPAIHPFNHSKHFLKRQGHHNYDPAFFLAIINSIILLVRYHFQLPYKSNAYDTLYVTKSVFIRDIRWLFMFKITCFIAPVNPVS